MRARPQVPPRRLLTGLLVWSALLASALALAVAIHAAVGALPTGPEGRAAAPDPGRSALKAGAPGPGSDRGRTGDPLGSPSETEAAGGDAER